METLGQKQERFSTSLAIFILKLAEMGYKIRLKEVFRTPEQAAIYAAQKKGIANSLHTKGLAADLALFKGGKYLTDSLQYAEAGTLWKSLGTDHRWGGDFSKPDGNHFSIEHEGVK